MKVICYECKENKFFIERSVEMKRKKPEKNLEIFAILFTTQEERLYAVDLSKLLPLVLLLVLLRTKSLVYCAAANQI